MNWEAFWVMLVVIPAAVAAWGWFLFGLFLYEEYNPLLALILYWSVTMLIIAVALGLVIP